MRVYDYSDGKWKNWNPSPAMLELIQKLKREAPSNLSKTDPPTK